MKYPIVLISFHPLFLSRAQCALHCPLHMFHPLYHVLAVSAFTDLYELYHRTPVRLLSHMLLALSLFLVTLQSIIGLKTSESEPAPCPEVWVGSHMSSNLCLGDSKPCQLLQTGGHTQLGFLEA